MNKGSNNVERIRAIVTDIDGSITDKRRRISTKAVEAIRTVEGNGVPVMLASGNVLPPSPMGLHRLLVSQVL